MKNLSKEMIVKLKRIKARMVKDPDYDLKVIGYDPKLDDDSSQFMTKEQFDKAAKLEKLLRMV